MRLLALLALLASASWADAVNLAARKPATQSSTYQNNPAYAAANGVDGQKYDTSLFSTEEEQSPWWEVDLGAQYAIENVMLYNRVGCCQERARGLQVLLSSDGENYKLVYTHDNTTFRNRRVDIGGLGARYVRVQLPYRECLHLQEVEVYQYGTWLPSTRPVKWTPVRIARSGPLPGPAVSGASIEGRLVGQLQRLHRNGGVHPQRQRMDGPAESRSGGRIAHQRELRCAHRRGVIHSSDGQPALLGDAFRERDERAV
jgi:hypothetical protein